MLSGEFLLASWNLQGGLRDGNAIGTVGQDLAVRKVSVGCFQETHVPEGLMTKTSAGRLICIPEPEETPKSQRYGLGFYVAEELWDNYVGYKWVSNRIAVLQLSRPSRRSKAACTMFIINVWTNVGTSARKRRSGGTGEIFGFRFHTWGDLWILRLIAEKGEGSWNKQIVKPAVSGC